MSAARSVIRSAAARASAATRLAGSTKSMPRPACSPFRISNQNPLHARIFRSPVEMSCCVETAAVSHGHCFSFPDFHAFCFSPEIRLDR
ncbi:hypothetical protein F3Y22_tig00111769pilonHSYRG00714 [Hibiscus syriacus]|uniref:Uncharacterized protein n=1 Tax=Hibiscus syriacus TaxID=106335 RepID=A0A6A2XW96_HIBSY|nr:hypothetical protein F3Y22_tig00111769pilonHSYRG00714 [Hibiscus syriacus]